MSHDDGDPSSEAAEAARRGRPRKVRREAAATILIVIGALATAIWAGIASGKPAPARCDELFDHYVDISLRQVDEQLTPWQREERVARAREKAEATVALRDCAANLTEPQAACAEKATNPNEFEQCFP